MPHLQIVTLLDLDLPSTLPLLSRPLSDLSLPSWAGEKLVTVACRDWYDGGSSSGGTEGGRGWPSFAISTKCIAKANSSMLSCPSLSKSDRCLTRTRVVKLVPCNLKLRVYELTRWVMWCAYTVVLWFSFILVAIYFSCFKVCNIYFETKKNKVCYNTLKQRKMKLKQRLKLIQVAFIDRFLIFVNWD